MREARSLTKHPRFKGVISDVGGPTANMYAISCTHRSGAKCKRRCLFPSPCPKLNPDHLPQRNLLSMLRKIPGINHVFVASGIRHDLVMADPSHEEYIDMLAAYHVSGQLKLAPEHSEASVLNAMGKPDPKSLLEFREKFTHSSARHNKKQFLTYYFIAAHPGCTEEDMKKLSRFVSSKLHIRPEQVQLFTPTPSTYATLMYATGCDPFSGQKLFVEKSVKNRVAQKTQITPASLTGRKKRR